jgi:hypothetical protein
MSRALSEAAQKVLKERFIFVLDDQLHPAVSAIPDFSGETDLFGDALDVGAEPHALHAASNDDPLSGHRRGLPVAGKPRLCFSPSPPSF